MLAFTCFEPWYCYHEKLRDSKFCFVYLSTSAKAKKFPFKCVTFQEIINEWDEQERIAQEKAEQESSLYRYRSRNSRTALSEEEEEEREFRKQFPLHEKVGWW